MKNEKIVIDELNVLRKKLKFRFDEPEFSYLNSSDAATIVELERTFNECIDDLLNVLKTQATVFQIKSVIRNGINRFDKKRYDTEEREYIAFYFDKLSNLLGIKINYILNSWLYGYFLATIFKLSGKNRNNQCNAD